MTIKAIRGLHHPELNKWVVGSGGVKEIVQRGGYEYREVVAVIFENGEEVVYPVNAVAIHYEPTHDK